MDEVSFRIKFNGDEKIVDKACDFACGVWSDYCSSNDDNWEGNGDRGADWVQFTESFLFLSELADFGDENCVILLIAKELAVKVAKKFPNLQFSIKGDMGYEDENSAQSDNSAPEWSDEFVITYKDKKLTYQTTGPFTDIYTWNSYYDIDCWYMLNGEEVGEEEFIEFLNDYGDGYVCKTDYKELTIYEDYPPLLEPRIIEIDWDSED